MINNLKKTLNVLTSPDILLTAATMVAGFTLFLFVCHAPSISRSLGCKFFDKKEACVGKED